MAKYFLLTKAVGGDNTRLEEDAQLKAYEMSRGFYSLCDLEVNCTTWKQDPDIEE